MCLPTLAVKLAQAAHTLKHEGHALALVGPQILRQGEERKQ